MKNILEEIPSSREPYNLKQVSAYYSNPQKAALVLPYAITFELPSSYIVEYAVGGNTITKEIGVFEHVGSNTHIVNTATDNKISAFMSAGGKITINHDNLFGKVQNITTDGKKVNFSCNVNTCQTNVEDQNSKTSITIKNEWGGTGTTIVKPLKLETSATPPNGLITSAIIITLVFVVSFIVIMKTRKHFFTLGIFRKI